MTANPNEKIDALVSYIKEKLQDRPGGFKDMYAQQIADGSLKKNLDDVVAKFQEAGKQADYVGMPDVDETLPLEELRNQIFDTSWWLKNARLDISDFSASDLNKVGFQLRALGYGEEAYAFAEKSIELDPNNHGQVAANVGNMAYCKGMIDGDFEAGLKFYEAADAYMKQHGLFTEAMAIKSDQNKGQVYNRMGMHDPVYFENAIECYERALEKIAASETLNKVENAAQKNQFLGQVGYCYAKTLACKAELDPTNTELRTNTMEQIDAGLNFMDAAKAGKQENGTLNDQFLFDYACFEVVKGQVLAACGKKEEALPWIEIGLVGQKQYGETVIPRIVSTSLKKLDIEKSLITSAMTGGYGMTFTESDSHYEKLNKIDSQIVENLKALQGFYGSKGHPDLAVYAKKYPKAYAEVFGAKNQHAPSPNATPRGFNIQ